MAQTIKHAKTSAIVDGTDTAQVQPSDWNANHTVTGTVDYSELSGKPATFPPTLPIAQSGVTNLVSDLALKAPLASPPLTGVPTAPTAGAGTATTQLATTAFVDAAIDAAGVAPIAPGYRNRLVNGDFLIDQRNAGVQVIIPVGTKGYGPDRWWAYGVAVGVMGLQRVADTTYLGEFYMNVAVGTADASLAATDVYQIGQTVEGAMLRGLNWGNANAKQVTVSFTAWANASFTLALAITNPGSTRSYVTTFAVTTTRQRFTFTIPGDVTGTWPYDYVSGLSLTIGLAVGTTYHAPSLNTWLGGNYVSHSSCSNFMAAGNTLNLKDVQLEIGAVATEYEKVSFPEQISRCQRYYHTLGGAGMTPRVRGYTVAGGYILSPFFFPVAMRGTPTGAKLGTWTVGNCGQPNLSGINSDGTNIQLLAIAAGETDAYPNSADDLFTFSSEL